MWRGCIKCKLMKSKPCNANRFSKPRDKMVTSVTAKQHLGGSANGSSVDDAYKLKMHSC